MSARCMAANTACYMAQVSRPGLALGLALLLSGCGLLAPKPSNQEAMIAVRAMLGQVGVPNGFVLASVTINSCVNQESPAGQLCDVTLLSTELPILGAISLPMRFRFAQRDGRWAAFLN